MNKFVYGSIKPEDNLNVFKLSDAGLAASKTRLAP